MEGGVCNLLPGQTPPPPGRHPSLWADTPLGRQPPTLWADTPHPRRPLQRTLRILLECILVANVIFHSALSFGGYEKVCVLFNIAAMQSGIAAQQSVESDEGLKVAAKLYQVTTYFYLTAPQLGEDRVPTRTGNLEKMGGIFQSGKSQGILHRLEKSGKITQNTRKVREVPTNVIYQILVTFKWTVHYLLKWLKFQLKNFLKIRKNGK